MPRCEWFQPWGVSEHRLHSLQYPRVVLLGKQQGVERARCSRSAKLSGDLAYLMNRERKTFPSRFKMLWCSRGAYRTKPSL